MKAKKGGIMKFSAILKISVLVYIMQIIMGCSQSGNDYRSGMYWLEKENNWQMAARSFKRALEKKPNSWKIHSKLIETLAMGEEPNKFEKQMRETIGKFPDRARSTALAGPGIQLLGEKRYNKLAASIELRHLSSLLAKHPDNPKILARCIMAACRVGDTLAVIDYYELALNSTSGEKVADSLLQEMRFFIGPSQIEWLRLEWHVKHHPDDINARLAQLEAGILTGDSAKARQKLIDIAKKMPEAVKKPEMAKRFGRLVGYDPFTPKTLARGWNGSYSSDGKRIIYIKNMGDSEYPDIYLYQKPASGGKEKPILKAAQQRLAILAWPRFSPDDKWIYFFGSSDKGWKPGDIGRFNFYRVRPKYNSSPEKLTDTDLVITDPYFEPDGAILLVRRDIGSVRSSVEVIRISVKTRKIEVVNRIGEPVSGAVFTPQGDSLLFITDRGIFRRSIEGGKITVDLPWIGMTFPQLSSDGKILKLNNRSGQMLILKREDVKPVYIGSVASPWITFGSDGSILTSYFIDGWKQVVRLDLNNPVKDVDSFYTAIK